MLGHLTTVTFRSSDISTYLQTTNSNQNDFFHLNTYGVFIMKMNLSPIQLTIGRWGPWGRITYPKTCILSGFNPENVSSFHFSCLLFFSKISISKSTNEIFLALKFTPVTVEVPKRPPPASQQKIHSPAGIRTGDHRLLNGPSPGSFKFVFGLFKHQYNLQQTHAKD